MSMLTNLSHLIAMEYIKDDTCSNKRTVVVRMVKTAVKSTTRNLQAPGKIKILKPAVPTVQAHVMVTTDNTCSIGIEK